MKRKAYLSDAVWMTPRFPTGDVTEFFTPGGLPCISHDDVRCFSSHLYDRWRNVYSLPQGVLDLALACEVAHRLIAAHEQALVHAEPHLVFAVQESALMEQLIARGIASECYPSLWAEPLFAAEALARITGAGHRVSWVNAACATGNYALGTARDMVRSGDADFVVVVAACSLFDCATPAFYRIGLAAQDRCLPGHPARSGTVVSEGAAALLVSNSPLDKPAVEIAGTGFSADAYNQIMPDPEGMWVLQAMASALSMACLNANQVDYVNLHGTGTVANDNIEMAALARLGARSALAGSTKAYTGHCLLSASAVEAAICRQLFVANNLPCDMYLAGCKPSPDGPQFHTGKPPRQGGLHVAMSNSFGFGGANSCIVLVREAA